MMFFLLSDCVSFILEKGFFFYKNQFSLGISNLCSFATRVLKAYDFYVIAEKFNELYFFSQILRCCWVVDFE